MGAAGDLGPDQGRFRVKYIGVDLFQRIPSQIVIAVAGGGGEAGGGNPVALHGGEHLGLVVFGDGVNGGKTVPEGLQSLLPVGVNTGRYAHFHIHIDQFFHKTHSFP